MEQQWGNRKEKLENQSSQQSVHYLARYHNGQQERSPAWGIPAFSHSGRALPETYAFTKVRQVGHLFTTFHSPTG